MPPSVKYGTPYRCVPAGGTDSAAFVSVCLCLFRTTDYDRGRGRGGGGWFRSVDVCDQYRRMPVENKGLNYGDGQECRRRGIGS